MTYEIEKVEGQKNPIFHVELGYMLGDADGEHSEVLQFSPEEFDKVLPYLEILLRLMDSLNDKPQFHIDNFEDFSEDYPGESCGLTEKQYETFIGMLNHSFGGFDVDLPDDTPEQAYWLAESLLYEYNNDYAYLEDIVVHYYDEEQRVRGVKFNY